MTSQTVSQMSHNAFPNPGLAIDARLIKHDISTLLLIITTGQNPARPPDGPST